MTLSGYWRQAQHDRITGRSTTERARAGPGDCGDYDTVPNGHFAAAMMRQSLAEAERAAVSGDVVAMLAAYEDLKGYEL